MYMVRPGKYQDICLGLQNYLIRLDSSPKTNSMFLQPVHSDESASLSLSSNRHQQRDRSFKDYSAQDTVKDEELTCPRP